MESPYLTVPLNTQSAPPVVDSYQIVAVKVCLYINIYVYSSWNSLVICRRSVQIEYEREREYNFVRANNRLGRILSEVCAAFLL